MSKYTNSEAAMKSLDLDKQVITEILTGQPGKVPASHCLTNS